MVSRLLAVIIAVSTLQQVPGDLGAALFRKKEADFPAVVPSAPKADFSNGPLKISLQKLRARSSGNGSFYVGKIAAGYPAQELQVVFDTGNWAVLLPHRGCKSKACQEHRVYSPWQSMTSMDVDKDGQRVNAAYRLAKGEETRDVADIEYANADLGTGHASGAFVKDRVCLVGKDGSKACAELGLVAAQSLDDAPFRALPNDGFVGLGLPGMSPCPSGFCNFLANLGESNEGMQPQFGISYGSTGGEIHVGGVDPAALKSPLQWFPVQGLELGFWQVPIRAVYAGDILVDDCRKGCHGVVDTASARLGVASKKLPKLQAALKPVPATQGSCHGPDLKFDLGSMFVTLGSDDYMTASCTPDLGALFDDDNDRETFADFYTFGETVLRHYFVAFDWGAARIGFAPNEPTYFEEL